MNRPGLKTLLAGLGAAALLVAASSDASAQGRRGRGRRIDKSPKVGTKAPDFKLKTLDGKKTVKLSEFKGKQPVALVFGSYT